MEAVARSACAVPLSAATKGEPASLALPSGGLRLARGPNGFAATASRSATRGNASAPAVAVKAASQRGPVCMAADGGAFISSPLPCSTLQTPLLCGSPAALSFKQLPLCTHSLT